MFDSPENDKKGAKVGSIKVAPLKGPIGSGASSPKGPRVPNGKSIAIAVSSNTSHSPDPVSIFALMTEI